MRSGRGRKGVYGLIEEVVVVWRTCFLLSCQCQFPSQSTPAAELRGVGAFRSWSRPVAAPTVLRRFLEDFAGKKIEDGGDDETSDDEENETKGPVAATTLRSPTC